MKKLILCCLLAWEVSSFGENAWWPQFRGPGGSGVSAEGDVPLAFNQTSNVVWRISCASGHSSLCIWDRHLFYTGVDRKQLFTFCLDRETGKELWRRLAPAASLEKTTSLGSPACSTPATDGACVVSYFGSYGLLCHNFKGELLWCLPLPTPVMQHGTGTSPILAGDNVILLCDQDVNSYLLAVNLKTGQIAWKKERPGFRRGFASPLIWKTSGQEAIIVAGTLKAMAYSAADGGELWSMRGLPNEMCATPVAGNGLIYVGGWTSGVGDVKMTDFASQLQRLDRNNDGRISQEESDGVARYHFPYIDANKDGEISREEWESLAGIFNESKSAFYAIKPGGKGDITQSHVAWSQTKGLPYVPSPLYYRGAIYLVKNGGLLTCLNAETGVPYYAEAKLGAGGDYYASPVAGNGKVILTSRKGIVTVVKAGEKLEIVAQNDLGDSILATPALVENRMYVRTQNEILAIGVGLRE